MESKLGENNEFWRFLEICVTLNHHWEDYMERICPNANERGWYFRKVETTLLNKLECPEETITFLAGSYSEQNRILEQICLIDDLIANVHCHRIFFGDFG